MTSDPLLRLKPDMEKCFRCSLCKMVPLPVVRHPAFTDACPAARLFHFHGYSGSGKSLMALSLVEGRIPADRRLAEIVFACTACGYCDAACKFIMDAERHRINMALRERLFAEGLAPEIHYRALAEEEGAGSGDGVAGAKWWEGLEVKPVPAERAEVLVFGGCLVRRDPTAARTARRLTRLLQRSGVMVGVLEEELCCGLTAYWRGGREVFIRRAKALRERLDDAGAGSVVSVSGSCLGVFRSKYPEYAAALERPVFHASEYLAELAAGGKLPLVRQVKRKVTYHDPCYLGRQGEPFVPWKGEEKLALGCMTYRDPPKKIAYGTQGVYDAPRLLLSRIPGLEFREMYRIREYSFCCGGGGGVPEAYPRLGRATAEHRLEEARAVGAEVLVSACHHCEAHLRNVQDTAALMPILDLVDLVAEAAGLDE